MPIRSLEMAEASWVEDDYQAAYIFKPPEGLADHNARHERDPFSPSTSRSSRRRKVSALSSTATTTPKRSVKVEGRGKGKAVDAADGVEAQDGSERSGSWRETSFVPLFNGAEDVECVRVREEMFERAWGGVEERIGNALKEVNRSTLDKVGAFVENAQRRGTQDDDGRIPAAFIITGPNIASQELLFGHLEDTLRHSSGGPGSIVVSLRSTEATNLKATLKKIIRDGMIMAGTDTGEEGAADVTAGKDGMKHLDYDIEALHASIKADEERPVTVSFQDSEGFDGGLLSELIALFSSWRDRIRFTLLFGVATSVELLQARLLKSTVRQLSGAQFDVVQASAVLDSVVKSAITGDANMPLIIGPILLRSLVDRQREQVAGVQVFIGSLKYAYMCHFYANPLSLLSVLCDAGMENQDSKLVQPEHLEAIRTLASFRTHVEAALQDNRLVFARSLLQDDDALGREVREQAGQRRNYMMQVLRSVHLITAIGASDELFVDMYIRALAEGIDLRCGSSSLISHVQRLSPDACISLLDRIIVAESDYRRDFGLFRRDGSANADEIRTHLSLLRSRLEVLRGEPRAIKSRYTAQNKALRTTVVAQKVQLSHDAAAMTDNDKAFTETIDRLAEILSTCISCKSVDSFFLNEAYVYDARTPHRDVFVPRPGMVIERALSRPHDYLSCVCCTKTAGENASTLPATSILYHLYLEAGTLVNVADLWSAYFGLIGGENKMGFDERTALVLFYRGLAELRAMGFVRQSRKKTDHVAKLKWL